jgi:hypothetical protein
MSKTTKNIPPSFTVTRWNGSTDPLNPLGASVVLYAAGPIPGTYAYAGPPVDEPWSPSPGTVPSTGLTFTKGCDHAADFKRMEEHLARIASLLETVLAGMKVREAATEMLEAVRTRKTKKR